MLSCKANAENLLINVKKKMFCYVSNRHRLEVEVWLYPYSTSALVEGGQCHALDPIP
jgi:hypothetical protein